MAAIRIEAEGSSISEPYIGALSLNGLSHDPNGTMVVTHTAGATATLVFNGTSVQVYGMIGPSGPDSLQPSSSYTIDGGTPNFYSGAMAEDHQHTVQFYESPQLSSGQHKLVVENLVDGEYFYLDYFLITPAPVTTAASQNAPATTFSASTSSADAGRKASTTVQTQTQLVTSKVVGGLSTLMSISTQTTASFGTSQSQFSTASGLGASSSGSGSSSGGSSKSSTATSKSSSGTIVGGVIGGIALLTLTIALVLFFRKRYRKAQQGKVHLWPPSPSGITPFPPPTPVPPPIMSQLSGTSYPSGKFDQQLFASGRAGAAFPADLPPAQVTGERHVTAPNDRSASSAGLIDAARHGEQEYLGGNALLSPGGRGTSHYRFTRDSRQRSENGSSMYTDRQ